MIPRGDATSRPTSTFAKNALILCVSLAFSLSIAEVALRAFGYKPWQPQPLDVSVQPGGKLFRVDPVLGYTNLPGQFTMTQATGYTWTATHGPDTLRITEPATSDTRNDSREEIWIFGCSYTYGWSLNDDETYPWLLQEKLPERRIVNFGVGGYGTINSLLQFREALKKEKTPTLIIVTYGPFHDARNTRLRKMGKANFSHSQTFGSRWRPYARLTGGSQLRIDFSELEYREFPLMRQSALIHLLENAYNDIEEDYFNSRDVSRHLLGEFATLAKKNNIRFIVAGIEEDSAGMLKDLAREGITTVDISVNLSIKGNRNVPHDGHPSFKAHQAYSLRLFEFLNETASQY